MFEDDLRACPAGSISRGGQARRKAAGGGLGGKAVGAIENETAEAIPGIDVDLIRMLAERLSKADLDAARLRSIAAQFLELNI